MAAVVNTKEMKVGRSVFNTPEAYLALSSASFFNSNLSTGIDMFDDALFVLFEIVCFI